MQGSIPSSPVRLPLQVGTSSLGHAAFGAALIVPSLLLCGGFVHRLLTGTEAGALWFVGPIAGYLAVFGILEVRHAWRTRASDLLLDTEGFAVEGGRHHGLRLGWAEIDPDRTTADTERTVRLTLAKIVGDVLFLVLGALLANRLELAPQDRVALRRLRVATRDGRMLLLAEAVHPAEQVSVEALFGTIRVRTRPVSGARPVAPPHVLSCASCGAPLRPADEEAVRCGWCGAGCPVPDEVRQGVRAAAAIKTARRGVAAALSELLRQPGARFANGSLVAAAVAALLSWLAVLGIGVLAGLREIDPFDAGFLLLAGLVLSAVFFVWARAAMARRRALHLVTSGFGARPPADERASWTCRQCGAPLPGHGELVEACAYCQAENVLGVDLRPEAELGRVEQLTLESVLKDAARERRRLRVLAVGMLLLGATIVAFATVVLESAQQVDAWRQGCAAGRAEACRQLGNAYDYGTDIGKDKVKACGLYEKACTMGDAEACDGLASCFIIGIDRPSDVRAGEKLRARACQMGYAPACNE